MPSTFLPTRFHQSAPDLPCEARPVVVRNIRIDRVPRYAHIHTGIEIGAVVSGNAVLYRGGERFALQPGDCYCTSGLVPHITCNGPDGAYQLAYTVVATEAILGLRPLTAATEVLSLLSPGWGHPPGLARARPDIAQALSLAASRSAEGLGTIDQWAAVLTPLMAMVVSLRAQSGADSPHEPVDASDRIAARACGYLQEHWSEPVSVDRLARLCGASRSHLSRRFAAAVGQSPIDYRNSIRIQHAIERIAASDRPIDVIAGECGFRSMANFGRIFRAITGRTPKSYRGR